MRHGGPPVIKVAAMSAAVAGVAAVLGLTAKPQAVPSIVPGPARVRVTAELREQRRLGSYTTAKTYALFNRPAYTDRIGTGVLTCTRTSLAWSSCRVYLQLSRGQIVGGALVPAAATFLNLAVAGGTGYYSNTGGTLSMQPLDSRHMLVLVVLEAF